MGALVSSLTSSSPPPNPQCLPELQLPHKHLHLGLLFLPLCLPRGSPRGSSLPSRPSNSQQPLLNQLSDPCSPSNLASSNSLSSNSPSSSSSLSLSSSLGLPRPSNKQHLSSSRISNLSSNSSSQVHSQALCS